jgi:hypothetical protein
MSPDEIIALALGPMWMRGRRYYRPLEPDVEAWYCYVSDAGHSILAAVRPVMEAGVAWQESLVPVPVRTFLRPTTHREYHADGYWIVDLPYTEEEGLITPPEDDEYGDGPGDFDTDASATLHIQNDGGRLVDTNYWATPLARAGFSYLSINAGVFRLLLPGQNDRQVVAEIRTATEVIITRGTWHRPPALQPDGTKRLMHPRPDALELLFEDDTATPYVMHLSRESIDRLPTRADEGREDLRLHVYTAGPTLALDFPARYRRASKLPYLKRWRA